MDQAMTCGWEVDRRDRRPILCGRPAKATATENLGVGDRLVCGVHARSARALGFDVEDLPGPDVRPGQVWADQDNWIIRGPARHVQVVEVDTTHATVRVVSPVSRSWGKERQSRIRLDRFGTSYKPVEDATREES